MKDEIPFHSFRKPIELFIYTVDLITSVNIILNLCNSANVRDLNNVKTTNIINTTIRGERRNLARIVKVLALSSLTATS